MARVCLTLLAGLLVAGSARAEDADRSAIDEVLEQLKAKDVNERMAGIRAAGALQHPKLVAPLTKLLTDPNQGIRDLAVEALALRKTKVEKKKAALALMRRVNALKKKEQQPELLRVIDALHDLAQKATMKPLLSGLKTSMDQKVLEKRVMAAANVPDKQVIDELIQLAASGRRNNSIRGSALRALRYATGEKVRGGADEWRRWWKDNKKDFQPIVVADKRAQRRAESAAKEEKRQERRRNKRRKKEEKGDDN
ncbi:MAG: HEAT repeat domain-containing protein [Planctomycetota bacterium]|nr:HEAT repeat domain-containing protein [Planctomycetota bacterium]